MIVSPAKYSEHATMSSSEIDFINGSVVRAGARCGVATPVNATLVACVKGIERWQCEQAAKACK